MEYDSSVAGTLSFTGNTYQASLYKRTLVGILSFVGDFVEATQYLRSLASTLSFIGRLLADFIPSGSYIYKDCNGALSFVGSLVKANRYLRSISGIIKFNVPDIDLVNSIDSYSEANKTQEMAFGLSTYNQIGNHFIGDGRPLNSMEFYLQSDGHPTGYMRAKVYEEAYNLDPESTLPGTLVATSDEVPASLIGSDWRKFLFPFTITPFTPLDGVNYITSCEYLVRDWANYVVIGYGAKPSGKKCMVVYNGTDWALSQYAALCFYAFATDVTPSLSMRFGKFLSIFGSLSFVGSLKNRIKRNLSGTLSFVGNIVAVFPLNFSGVLSFTGALTQVRRKWFNRILSFIGEVDTWDGKEKTLQGRLSFRGGPQTKFAKSLGSRLWFTGTVISDSLKKIVGTLSFIGDTRTRTFKKLAGNISFIGILDIWYGVKKYLAGRITFAGAIITRTEKVISGRLTFAGVLGGIKGVYVILAGALSFVGDLIASSIINRIIFIVRERMILVRTVYERLRIGKIGQ